MPGERATVPTGLRLEIPPGLEAQVRPRSGLAAKWGVTVLNAPGTIDSDYRGELKVILVNHGNEPCAIHTGDRIAQLVFCPVVRVAFQRKSAVADTRRGSGGFGSTGA
jgi:dUTP pyrophosphatase